MVWAHISAFVCTYVYNISGQNKRGHHFVWPAICCSRGFVRALGVRVTLGATPVGSWGPWAFAEPFVQSFVVASCTLFPFVEVRNARRGSQNLRASNLVATQSADPTYLALNISIYIYMYICIYGYMYVCIGRCVYVHACIRFCTCVYVGVYDRICIYVDVCACIYRFSVCADIVAEWHPVVFKHAVVRSCEQQSRPSSSSSPT